MSNSSIMVSMKFEADTSQAKAKMKELETSLRSIQSVTNQTLPMNQLSSGLDQAKVAAAQLEVQLKSAFNTNTGKLDLSKFNSEMKKSGMNLEKYKTALLQAGPAGKQAFTQLATAIASADTRVIRINESLAKMGTRLLETARWRASNAAIMAVTSSISEAYRFAQDLDKSLTDIRIVTGLSAEYMEDFAKNAQKAAKALSTTTNEYAKASLIYFQQGLSEAEVQERTELTIRMANVTGQSVQEVSDQLTAVWNNFDDGTQTLEHYVDVMVALGAATASSSEEISQGLNKFAAVAETVGLSYEYAAAALATVTAETRQSADVVGTAFKTLFARIQDLELGETLDDGTTLGQYSQALAAVGINIKDVNGEVKDMNLILDEMGSKWNNLTKNQQIALAQSVAGVRQYTQLIALMDNWSTFQDNLNTAMTSQGASQEQAEIYAESWEAARDRVTASLEQIYMQLLDDDAFKSILNFFADLIENIGGVIESVGGLKGVLLALGTVLLNLSRNSLANAMTSMGTMMMSWTKTGKDKLLKLREEGANAAADNYSTNTFSQRSMRTITTQEVELARTYQQMTEKATEQQREILRILRNQVEEELKRNRQAAESLELAESEARVAKRQLLNYAQGNVTPEQVDAYSQNRTRYFAFSNFMGQLAPDDFSAGISNYLSGDYSTESLSRADTVIKEAVHSIESLGLESSTVQNELAGLFGPEALTQIQAFVKAVRAAQTEVSNLLSMQPGERRPQDPQKRVNEIDEEIKNKGYSTNHIEAAKKGEKTYSSRSGKTSYDVDNDLIKLLEERARLLGKNQSAANGLEEAIGELSNVEQEFQKDMNQSRDTIEAGISGNEEAQKSFNQLSGALAQTGEGGAKLAAGLHGFSGAADNFKDKADKATHTIIGLSTKIATAASSIMSLTMAVQSIKSLGSIWSDKDAEVGDQILQTIMALAPAVLMLVSGLNRKNIATLFGLVLDEKTLKYQNAKRTADGKEIVATGIKKLVQDAFNSSLWGTVAVYVVLIGLAALVILGIAALIGAFSDGADRTEVLTERTKELTEAFNEAKNAAEELKSTISDYDDGIKAIEELTKGTEEYAKAVEESNKKAKALIETYGLFDDYTYQDGIIRIDPEALEKAQREADQTAGRIESNLYATKLALSGETENSLLEQLRETLAEKEVYAGSNYAASYGQTFVSMDESDFQTLLSRAKEKRAEKLDVNLDADEIRGLITGLEGFDDIKESFPDLNEVIESSVPIINDYIDSINQAAEANRYYAQQILKNNIEEQYGDKFRELATDSEGNFDQAMYERLLEGYAAQQSSDELVNELKAVDQSAVTDAENFGIFLSGQDQGQNQPAQQAKKASREQAARQLYGDTFVDTKERKKEDFYQAYAQSIFGDDKKYSFSEKDGKVTITNQNTAQEIGSFDPKTIMQFMAEEIEARAIANEYGQRDYESRSPALEALAAGGTADKEYSANISGVLLDAYAKGNINQVDFSTIFGQLSQSEVEELKGLNNWELISKLGLGYNQLTSLGGNIGALGTNMRASLDNWTEEAYFSGANLAGEKQAEAFDIDVEEFKAYRDLLLDTNDAYADNVEGLNAVALANKRLEKGVKALSDDWEDFDRIMSNENASLEDLSSIIPEINEALQDVLNLDTKDFSLLPPTFAKDNWQLIQDVMNGVEGAVDTLRNKAGEEILLNVKGAVDEEGNINSQLADIHNAIASYDGMSFEIGAEINSTEFIQSCNSMLAAAQWTSDQAKAYFKSMGYNVKLKEIKRITTDESTYQYLPYDKEASEKAGIPQFGPPQTVTLTQQTQSTGFAIESITADGSYGGGVGVETTTSTGRRGGGGGGGSKQEKKDNSEIERYHEIQEVINDLSREYDKLSKAKDRAFGADRLSLMDKEFELIEKQIEAQEEQLRQIEEFRKLDKEKLSEYGASFDEAGRITNFDEMYEANIKSYNEAVDKVNSGAMSDDQFEEYEKQFDEFVADIEQYEETLNLLEDEEVNLIDLQNQLFDAKLAKISYEIEIDTRLAENEIAYLEYQFEKLDDTIGDTALSLQNLGKQAEQNLKKIAANQRSIKDTLELSGFSEQEIDVLLNGSSDISSILKDKALTDEQISMLEKYRDSLMDTNTIMLKLRQRIHDELVGAFEEMNEEMDYQMESIDHLSNMLQNYRDIIDLVGHENLGISDTVLAEMSRANVENTRAALQAQRNILDSNKAALADAEAALARARVENQEEDIKLWEETVKTLSEKVAAGEEELMSRWQSSLQAAADALSDAVDQIMKTFEKAMSGLAESFDALQTKYDQQKEINDRYLDDYQKIYELSKLNRDISNSIDDTDSIRAKSRLRDIQEEINELQASNAEMTQYEVNELRARYELRLAEIALEEAQNAKSQVRMSRDSEGNWSYVYTADQAKIDEAQQNYEDKLYAYQDLTQKRAEEIEDQILGLPKEFSEAVEEIMMDLTLTEEEKWQKVFETRKYYEDKYNYLLGQIETSMRDAKRLYTEDWNDYSKNTGYKISLEQEWADVFAETTLAQTTGFASVQKAGDAFKTSTEGMLTSLKEAYQTYQTDVKGIMGDAKFETEGFAETITEGSVEAANSVKSLAEAGAEGFSGLVEQAQNFADSYGKEIDKYIGKNDEMITSLNKVLNLLARVDSGLASVDTINRQEVENAEAQAAEVEQIVSSGGGGGGGLGLGGPTGGPPVEPEAVKPVYYWRVMYDADGRKGVKATPQVYKTGTYANAIDALNAAKEKYIAEWAARGVGYAQAEKMWLDKIAKGYYYAALYSLTQNSGHTASGLGDNQMHLFNTGGYTGEWGPEGRLAVLHQKELVLNAQDTENFLHAIDVVRSIADIIDLRAVAQQTALSMMQAGNIAPIGQTLQQEVTIHAEFPNATQRTEIEAAFDTLLNRASQFANRKNK